MDDAGASHPALLENAKLRAQLAKYEATIAAQRLTMTQREQRLAKYEAMVAEREQKLAALTEQRDAFYLENLRLHVRLAQLLKQAYGPRADRLTDPGQLLLDFASLLDAQPAQVAEVLAEAEQTPPQSPAPRRIRTRGRRDIADLVDLPLIEQKYELPGEMCACPACAQQREQIGAEVSYTIEYLPGSFLRIKHVQCKYACRTCEQEGFNPNIELAAKTNGSPIDKGMPGPGLLAFITVSKFADYQPLHRLENIFARQGFELDRSTMCLWMGDVARLVRPVYDRMVARVLQSHVLATDDTVMPLQAPGKTKKARMWIYRGDDDHPYNVFDFTESRGRDGPAQFLRNFQEVLLADGYGGYDGIVVAQELQRAGCWAHARRKFVDAQAAGPEFARAVVHLINVLFKIEQRAAALSPEERLRLRQVKSRPVLHRLRGLLIEQKLQMVPKHPLAEAVGYVLNQWAPLTLFVTDAAVPIHNNLAEQQMKRIALLRKNALFVGNAEGGQSAAILSSLTSTCQRHGINPQRYFTQLLANARDLHAADVRAPSPTDKTAGLPVDPVDVWLPDRWNLNNPPPTEEPQSSTADSESPIA